jgi:hypothetical protein
MNLEQPDLAKLEEAANLATRATQAAADKVADLESQLAAARSDLEAAKGREMEARRAFSVAEDAQQSGS